MARFAQDDRLWGHILPEELHYIRICGMPYFAPGELHKIENYSIASSQGYYGWHLHHKNGTEKSNINGKRVKDLKAEGLYYLRPASELIFLTAKEHRNIHHVYNSTYTIDMHNPAYVDACNKYSHIMQDVSNGKLISLRDYWFIDSFCYRINCKKPDCSSSIDLLDLCTRLIKKGISKKRTRDEQDLCIEELLLMLDIDPDGTLSSDIKSAMVCDPEVLALNGGKPIMRKPHYHPRGFFACPELFK